MKNKVSKKKKFLSLFLAALMVVSSVPLWAFTTLAADTTAVNNAIAKYESKMNGSVYTNMKAAYDAYIDANEALDAVNYGDKNVDLSAAANALNTATDAMQPWTAATFTAQAYHSGNNVTSVATGGYSNVVYASQTTNFTGEIKAGWYYILGKVAVPNVIVFAYDGTNPVYGPAVFESKADGGHSQKIRYVSSGNSTFGFNQNWQGFMATKDDYGKWPADNIEQADSFGYSSSNMQETATAQTNTGTKRYWWNRLTYFGTGNTTDYYESVSNITFTLDSYKDYMGKGWKTASQTASHTNYVINYEPIAANSAKLAAKLSAAVTGNGINSYLTGGLSDILSALDVLTVDAVNPNSYSYDDSNAQSNVQTCAAAIKAAATAYNYDSINAGVSGVSGYQALRDALDATKTTFDGGAEGYTPDSWSVFNSAYLAAKAVFENIQSTSYNDNTAAQTKADALLAAKGALETVETKVDTTLLEVVINNADVAIKEMANGNDIFTADSWAAADLVNVVNQAKTAIWTDPAKYGDDSAKIAANEADNALVESYTQQLTAIIASLKPNLDNAVPSIEDFSLNSIIAEAGKYNAADYANYDAVTKALDAANKFIAVPTVLDATQPGIIAAGIAEYQKLIKDIYNAINLLQPAFSNLENGTIANAGTTRSDKVGEDTAKINQNEKSVRFIRQDGVILFRTTHDAAAFDLGAARLDFYAAGDSAQHFDSINLNDLTGDDAAELRSVTSETDSACDLTNFPGGLTAPINGATFELKNIKVAQGSDSSGIGKDNNGNNVTDTSYDFTSGLATSSGTYPVQGAITAKKGTTVANANFVLNVPATANSSLSASTKPSMQEFNFSGYLGEVYWFKFHQTVLSDYFGYVHARAPYTQSATVIDVTYLMELIKVCSNLSPNAYTDASYKAMTDALTAAKAEMPYGSMTASAINQDCVTRYTNLWRAYYNLAPRTVSITFNYADGKTVTNNVTYGKDVVAPTDLDYKKDGVIYTFKEWSPAFSATAEYDVVYTAVYDQTLDAADFSDFNAAKEELVNALKDRTFTVAALNAVQAAIDDISFYGMTADEQKEILSTQQAEVDRQAAAIRAAIPTAAGFDTSAADAIEKLKAGYDKDQYDEAVIGAFEIYTTVTVADKTYEAFMDNTQEELDARIDDVLNSTREYSITLNGTVIKDNVPYGSHVIVDAQGNVHFADDTEQDMGDVYYSWYYKYSAPSGASSELQYMTNSPSFGFIVKGDTVLEAKTADKDAGYTVAVRDNIKNKVIAILYTDAQGNFTLPEAPKYAYYNFTGYSDGFTAGAQQVSGNTTIIANYEAIAGEEMYRICAFVGYDGFYADYTSCTDKQYYYYNEKVTADASSMRDFFCWAEIVDEANIDVPPYTLRVVSYEANYAFHACSDISIVALSKDEAQKLVDGTLTCQGELHANEFVYSNNSKIDPANPMPDVSVLQTIVPIRADGKLTKISLIGQYCVPEGYSVVEAGMLVNTASGTVADEDFNVENTSIKRVKVSKITVGNQFVVNFNTPNGKLSNPIDYCAYTKVKDAAGHTTVIYSPVIKGATVD